MTTEYQLLSRNESNSNLSNEDSAIIIPMATEGAFGMPRRTTSRQERRVPIPWYLDGCKLTKIVIFIVILLWTILVVWQVLRLGNSQPISYEDA